MALAMRSDGTANISINKMWEDVCKFQIKAYLCIRNSGCSSARLEYASGGRVVAGSNPVTPTFRLASAFAEASLNLFLADCD